MCVNVCDLLGIHFVTVTGKIRFQVIQLTASPQRPPWGPKKETFVERFKRESVYG